jgi:hypothetical protein
MADLLTDAILKDLLKDIRSNFPPERKEVLLKLQQEEED